MEVTEADAETSKLWLFGTLITSAWDNIAINDAVVTTTRLNFMT
jgi:hypothetical protein